MTTKKQAKKHYKNIQRCLKHLSAVVGSTCTLSTQPTSRILLGNAGHANGIGRSDVVALLNNYLDPAKYKLHFPPDKQFSLLFTDDICSDLLQQIDTTQIKNNCLYCTFISEPISFDSFAEVRPPGLQLVMECVERDVEEQLMNMFLSHSEDAAQEDLKNRITLHYGYKFDYKINSVDLSSPLDEPIPSCVQEIINKLAPHITITPNQLTVNIYQPGQGIPKHVDTHSIFTSEILSLSLGSDVLMDFKNPETGVILPVLIPARSLTVMSGESRYLWHHGITPRKTDALMDVTRRELRISLTLRECTPEPCTCAYPSQCDSQNYGKPDFSVHNEQDAAAIEREYVGDVYEKIADHFSSTRHTTWPGVVRFINSLPRHSVLVDVGCGNGKYLGVRDDVLFIGNDNSYNLCTICRDRGREVFACNALSIPLRAGTCDAVICIAMLHHITTPERRKVVLQNLAQLLRPGGLCLVTVWAQEQHLDMNNSKEESVCPCPTDSTEEGVGRRHFTDQDVFVDWKKDRSLYYRYYHVFLEGELDGLIRQLDNVEIVEVTYEKANWCAVFRKTC